MVEFHLTRRGAKFYDHDVPRIAEALESIAVALQALRKEPKQEHPEAKTVRRLYINTLKLTDEEAAALGIDRQSFLCELRNGLAQFEGRSEQDVQDDYEHQVATGAV